MFRVILFSFIQNAKQHPPFDVCLFFLFQESRINCIRIARKGNSAYHINDHERIQDESLSALQNCLSLFQDETLRLVLLSLVCIALLFFSLSLARSLSLSLCLSQVLDEYPLVV